MTKSKVDKVINKFAKTIVAKVESKQDLLDKIFIEYVSCGIVRDIISSIEGIKNIEKVLYESFNIDLNKIPIEDVAIDMVQEKINNIIGSK